MSWRRLPIRACSPRYFGQNTPPVAVCTRRIRLREQVKRQGIASTHHLGNTPVPASSPYGLMRDYPAYIMLLGVGFEMCTAIHHPEEVLAPDIYVKPLSEAEYYELRARDGHVVSYQLRRHQHLDRKFSKYETSLARAGAAPLRQPRRSEVDACSGK